jgi:hypothetical protein
MSKMVEVGEEVPVYVLKVEPGQQPDRSVAGQAPVPVTWDSMKIGDVVVGKVVRWKNSASLSDRREASAVGPSSLNWRAATSIRLRVRGESSAIR